MLNRIKAFLLDENDRGGAPGSASEATALAAAALLVEAARMDDSVGPEERARILALVRERFALNEEEARTLLSAAEGEVESSVQWHGFASTIRQRFSETERVRLIEMLWEVAYADGELHDLEASLLRRVAGLLYVSDRDRGEARQRALERLGLSDSSGET